MLLGDEVKEAVDSANRKNKKLKKIGKRIQLLEEEKNEFGYLIKEDVLTQVSLLERTLTKMMESDTRIKINLSKKVKGRFKTISSCLKKLKTHVKDANSLLLKLDDECSTNNLVGYGGAVIGAGIAAGLGIAAITADLTAITVALEAVGSGALAAAGASSWFGPGGLIIAGVIAGGSLLYARSENSDIIEKANATERKIVKRINKGKVAIKTYLTDVNAASKSFKKATGYINELSEHLIEKRDPIDDDLVETLVELTDKVEMLVNFLNKPVLPA